MRPPKLSALFLTTAMAMDVAGSAQAADPVDCDNPANWVSTAAMTTRMKSEGQRIYAAGTLIRNQQIDGGMVFTTNENKSEGYILRTDKGVDSKTEKMCVYKRMANLRFFDVTKEGVRQESLLAASDEAASKACDDLAKADSRRYTRSSCGSLNKQIRSRDLAGDKVIAQGFNVEKQPDGSYKSNGWLTTISVNMKEIVSGNEDVASGVSYTKLPNGATFTNAILIVARPTPYGLALIQ